MFGAINALFAGLAFAGVIIAILIQQKELSLQVEELSLTRKEYERQSFEKTFFHLLEFQRELVENMTFQVRDQSGEQTGNVIRGRDCFEAMYIELKNQWELRDCFKTI